MNVELFSVYKNPIQKPNPVSGTGVPIDDRFKHNFISLPLGWEVGLCGKIYQLVVVKKIGS